MGGFAHVLAYKSPKTPFFALMYLTRYTHETFFEAYTNFEGPYLSRCRDIPLQSFGSHIRPQPHGLGLKYFQAFVFSPHHALGEERMNTSWWWSTVTFRGQNSPIFCIRPS
jgi:hypothetical protein